MNKKFTTNARRKSESGQTILFVMLGLGLFLIGAMAFAIDLGHMWFQRQAAQTAADAACTAGAMDLLVDATNGTTTQGGFTAGTPFDCNTHPSYAPCSYAALNGFNSSLTQASANSGTVGNNVFVDFPTSVANVTTPPVGIAPTPFIRVAVTDNFPAFFAGMLRGTSKQKIGATSVCGVIQATSPIPILVLNPKVTQSFSIQGTPTVAIVGGPNRSIQVNSCSATNASAPCGTGVAANMGGNASVNLCAAGQNYCGSSMGVWGTESTPGGYVTSCTGNRPAGAPACTGTQQVPQWNSPSAPIADPFATISAPSLPTLTPTPATGVLPGVNGCPALAGNTCTEYSPGYYPSGILVKNTVAIFDPGIYYLAGRCKPGATGSFCSDSNSCIRPSSATGDGSGGTIFYFADSNGFSVNVGANAGCNSTSGAANPFNTTTGTGSLANGVKCAATSNVPSNLPSTLTGSVLLAPCQAPTVSSLCASANSNANCNLNFCDALGVGDPIGVQRGILFFQDRAVNAAGNPNWSGGGSTLLAGTMYFHECVASGSDTGQNCSSSAYNDQLSLGGGSGSSTYVLGDVIVDQLQLQGNSGITMDLNPSAAFTTLKASLLQ